MMWIRLRRSKRLERPQNGGSRKEKVEEYSPRRLSFLDRMNMDQAMGDLGDLSRISNDKDEL